MIDICHYDGTDHSLVVERAPQEDTPAPRCRLHAYTDTDGWRCFTDHEGTVIKMRFDLVTEATNCSLVGKLMGLPAQGIARDVLDEVRGQPGVSRTRSTHE